MPKAAECDAGKKIRKLTLDVSVSVRWEPDDDPDLSYLGKYTDQHVEGAIDRKALGDATDREYQYFVSANHSVFRSEDWSHVSGQDKKKVIKKHGSLKNAVRAYAMEDYRRMEAYNRGEWAMEGCVVTARLGSLKAESSLWGVESDAGKKYRDEIEQDQINSALAELQKKILARLEVE